MFLLNSSLVLLPACAGRHSVHCVKHSQLQHHRWVDTLRETDMLYYFWCCQINPTFFNYLNRWRSCIIKIIFVSCQFYLFYLWAQSQLGLLIMFSLVFALVIGLLNLIYAVSICFIGSYKLRIYFVQFCEQRIQPGVPQGRGGSFNGGCDAPQEPCDAMSQRPVAGEHYMAPGQQLCTLHRFRVRCCELPAFWCSQPLLRVCWYVPEVWELRIIIITIVIIKSVSHIASRVNRSPKHIFQIVTHRSDSDTLICGQKLLTWHSVSCIPCTDISGTSQMRWATDIWYIAVFFLTQYYFSNGVWRVSCKMFVYFYFKSRD